MDSNKSGITAVHASSEDVRTPDETHKEQEGHRPAVIGGFEADIDALPPGYFKSRFFVGTFFAIGFGLMAGVGAFVNIYTWISLVYSAACAVCIAPLGRITDIFGRRYWFIGSGVLSVIGSIVCATAKSIPVLIGGNVLLGVGTAAQLSFHYVVGEIVPIKYRYLASAGVYLFCFPGSGSYWIKHFDYVGTLLFAAGLVMFLMGLSWGGAVYPWNSAATISAIVIGFALLVAFALWEIYAPLKEPLVPVHLFKNLEWTVSVLLMSLGASIYYGFAIVWPAQCATLYNTGDMIYLGGISSIIGLAVIVGQIVGGSLAERIGHTRIQVMAVFTLAAIFLGCTAVSQPDNFKTAAGLVFMGLFFTGWNETICIANSTICVKNQQEIGIAGGLAGSIRSAICGVIVAIYTTVLTNRLGQTIPAEVPPALVSAGLPSSSVVDFLTALTSGVTGAVDAVPGITDKIIAVGVAAYKQANADAYRTVYLSTLAFSGVAICLTYFAPNTDTYMTSQIAATLHREEVPDNEKVLGEN
ncbi:MFS general substrate transporter [Coniochaeta ligniaria NRRL 30616]|uniref:MFS general substrate transporter n=1 Tax=Coniochaeta ligniaria NRRL 30616 TaxID=1408157 RepID=A0A1J7I4W9_9PEZI|nr:MFS general substrate transporter [Coniochaeta ligniaria NRRL 30616]